MKVKDSHLGQYILVTPVKNEEKNLPTLMQSIEAQTLKPILWLIVDDGSTDNTPKIIKHAKEEHDWIQSIQLGKSARDLGLHIAEVEKKGFDFAVEYCDNNGLKFDYMGNVDGDVILEESYYETLIKKFEKDPKLGIASGEEFLFYGKQMKRIKHRWPYGGSLLIRRECFEDCGGIPQSYSWDAVLNAKAKLEGWRSGIFSDVKHFSLRAYDSAEGSWNGYKERGKSYYFLGFNPFHAFFRGLRLLFRKPYYVGIAFIYGYFTSLILRKGRIEDKRIKHYYRYVRPRELIQQYFNTLKNFLKRVG